MSSVTAVPIPPTKRSYLVWLWVGIALAVAGAVALAWVGTRTAAVAAYSNEDFLAWNKKQAGVQTTASGLQYKVIEPGEGATAADNDGVELEIHGIKRDGKEFQPRAPMQFQIGQPMIPGFTEGVKLMRKGARYRFWLPPNLGYGADPNAQHELADDILIFDVEMKNLVPAAVIQQMMMQQMMQQQMQQGGAPGGPPQGR
ncbi:FKBP-type peptidyl-prolyl cis-trans isomerase [Sphingomonas sp.]|uniref:FKBP-type peptidyl-prolyl cis-trans isomerase n=1 Tax=Sphingomonas sp. TaxID=28214 RepID=UPI002ED9B6E9